MLVLTRKEGEAIFIYPADHIDDAMTVKELFSHGPIKVSIVMQFCLLIPVFLS